MGFVFRSMPVLPHRLTCCRYWGDEPASGQAVAHALVDQRNAYILERR